MTSIFQSDQNPIFNDLKIFTRHDHNVIENIACFLPGIFVDLYAN